MIIINDFYLEFWAWENLKVCKGPAKRIQHVDATSSNIVESNMLQAFSHHVARCCMMLDDVERSLISIKYRLQHHPTFLCSYVWTKMWHSFSHLIQHCWMRACPLSWLCGYLFPWQWFTVYTCFVRSAWKIRYGGCRKFLTTLRRKYKRPLRK